MKTLNFLSGGLIAELTRPVFPLWSAGLAASVGAWAFVRGTSRIVERERQDCLTDYLTGISNSRGFHETVQRELSRCRRRGAPITVGFMDCDDFKAINDREGHLAGNAMLQIIAETACASLRDEDVLARYGGDEFAIALPEAGEKEARRVLERLHSRLTRVMQGKGWPVTFSLGAVCAHLSPPSVEPLIDQADKLMYQLKRNGKNRIAVAST